MRGSKHGEVAPLDREDAQRFSIHTDVQKILHVSLCCEDAGNSNAANFFSITYFISSFTLLQVLICKSSHGAQAAQASQLHPLVIQFISKPSLYVAQDLMYRLNHLSRVGEIISTEGGGLIENVQY